MRQGSTSHSFDSRQEDDFSAACSASTAAPHTGRGLSWVPSHERWRWRSPAQGSRTSASAAAGNSAVEFALVAPMFFLLFFSIFDFARIFYAQMTLQNAVRQAGRYAITGNHLPDPQHSGQSLSRVNSIISVAQQAAGGLSVSNIQILSAAGGSGSAGGPGDTVTISLSTSLQLMTPVVAQFFQNGAYSFNVSVSFKNEPFPPSNTT